MGKLLLYWNIVFFLENPDSISPEDYLEDADLFLSLLLKKSKDLNGACKGAEQKCEGRKKVMIKKAKFLGSQWHMKGCFLLFFFFKLLQLFFCIEKAEMLESWAASKPSNSPNRIF